MVLEAKYVLLALLTGLMFQQSYSQSHQTYQTLIYDKVTNRPVNKATCILIQKKDRKMLGYGRTNGLGVLKISADSLQDTILVWVFHKRYIDYQEEIVYNKLSRYRDTITLIPKSRVLRTVIIKSNKAITMNGDTVTYVADSFKLPEGASAEELLKRLPGIQVLKDGTIKAQGTKVDRVLVDGDDFFGEDASVATKNLDASMIDKVEVIDAETRASEISGSDDEKMKIINLKLKDEAKKGYFGRLEQGYSNTNRYQSTAIANVFHDNTKVAGFITADNIRARMSWQDMRDLGISNQNWTYDEDLDEWVSNGGEGGVGNTLNVIPQNLKTGGNLNQKFIDGSGVLKARFNYTQGVYDGSQTYTSSRYFNDQVQNSNTLSSINSKNRKNSGMISIDKTIDTHQKVHFALIANLSRYEGWNKTEHDILLDSTIVNTSIRENPFDNKSENYSAIGTYERKFGKKGRFLGLKLDYTINSLSGERFNIMNGQVYESSGDSAVQSLDQKTVLLNKSNNLKGSARFIEPLPLKGFYAQMGLSFVNARNTSFFNSYERNAFNNDYTTAINQLSNNYHYNVSALSEQLELNYKNRKIDWFVGAKVHQVKLEQINLDSGKMSLNRNFNYILPMASFSWKYRRNSNLKLNLRKGVTAPKINQIQPFVDNSNPQNIVTGNPDLSPIQSYSISVRNNFWYPVSKTNLWSRFSFKVLQDDIVDSTFIDEKGVVNRYYTQLDGNKSANMNLWYGFTFKPLELDVNPGFWLNWNERSNYFNHERVKTNNIWSGFYLELSKSLDSLLESSLEFHLNWSQVESDNPSFQNATNLNWDISTKQELRLPSKFKLIGELEYKIIPSNSSFGTSQSFTLLNASIERPFLRGNSLIAKLTFYDILGQNRAINRNFYQNNVSETISQALTRYIMLTMTYKFRKKRKQKEDEMDF